MSFLKNSIKILDEGNLHLDSIDVPYVVKRSLRAKMLWLRIKADKSLIITVPKYYNLDLLDNFLKSKFKWIKHNISKIDIQKSNLNAGNSVNTVPYLGKILNIVKNCNKEMDPKIVLNQDQLIIRLDPGMSSNYAAEVEIWLKSQAQKQINARAQEISNRMGLIYNKVSIRNQKSRWGSCSHKRNLSFNWKLIMLPEPVLDYVVIHELSHLSEMNHSIRFWNLVERYCPEWKNHRKWLNQHNGYLFDSLNIEG